MSFRWSPVRPLLLGLAAAGLLACGGAPNGGGAGLDFGLMIDGAVADQTTQFQVALLAHGSSYDCAKIQQTCLNASAVKDSDFIRLTDSSGQQKKVLVFANALSAGGTTATQDVALDGLSPGKDFAVVVEAIAPGQLLGSSCNYVPEIRSGSNGPVLAVIQPAPSGTSCDPKFP